MVRALFSTLLTMLALLPTVAAAESGNVLQVITVNVAPEQVAAYAERVEQLVAVQMRLNTAGKVRMWLATPPDTTAGNVIVSIEYTDMNEFAANFARLEADPEWQDVMQSMPGIRDLLSSAVYTEVTP